jgi:hypothetical protein
VRLVDDHPAVDAEKNPPRRSPLVRRCIGLQRQVKERDIDAGGLAAGGRQGHYRRPVLRVPLGVKPLACDKVIDKPPLPRVRIYALQRLEESRELLGP